MLHNPRVSPELLLRVEHADVSLPSVCLHLPTRWSPLPEETKTHTTEGHLDDEHVVKPNLKVGFHVRGEPWPSIVLIQRCEKLTMLHQVPSWQKLKLH